jgi:hypothetical protein
MVSVFISSSVPLFAVFPPKKAGDAAAIGAHIFAKVKDL